jgi:hypothetical protein
MLIKRDTEDYKYMTANLFAFKIFIYFTGSIKGRYSTILKK